MQAENGTLQAKIQDEAGKAGRFGLVGLAATAVHLGIAQLALLLWGAAPWLANLIGFAAAFTVGLAGHQWFTFRGVAPLQRSVWRYGAIALAGLLATNIVLEGLRASGALSDAAALTIAILVVPAISFVASRFWGFAPAR